LYMMLCDNSHPVHIIPCVNKITTEFSFAPTAISHKTTTKNSPRTQHEKTKSFIDTHTQHILCHHVSHFESEICATIRENAMRRGEKKRRKARSLTDEDKERYFNSIIYLGFFIISHFGVFTRRARRKTPRAIIRKIS
jgi:hypothetical protein